MGQDSRCEHKQKSYVEGAVGFEWRVLSCFNRLSAPGDNLERVVDVNLGNGSALSPDMD